SPIGRISLPGGTRLRLSAPWITRRLAMTPPTQAIRTQATPAHRSRLARNRSGRERRAVNFIAVPYRRSSAAPLRIPFAFSASGALWAPVNSPGKEPLEEIPRDALDTRVRAVRLRVDS